MSLPPRRSWPYCLVLALAWLPAAAASAEGLIASPESGWPQWRGPRRDGVSEERDLLSSWPEDGPRLLWQRDGLGTGWSSPIIHQDRIFITGDVGDDLVVFALDANGQQLWRATNGRSWQGSYPGARASCGYSEGRLYHLNAHGRLVALDAGTGQELWHVNILERFDAENITWAMSECVVVDGDHVIVTPGGRGALMAALDKRDGVTRWTTPALENDLTSYSSPILFSHQGRRLLASCSSAHGFGVDADSGELLWTVPLSNQHKVNTATPIYGSGAIYYVTPYGEEGRLYGLDLDQRPPRVDELWQIELDTVTGSGVLVDGTLFAAGYRKNKWWMAIDWATGAIRSELKDLTTGAAVYADGRLYCLDDRGAVGMIAVQGGELQLAGKFQLVKKRVQDAWAHPVLLDKRLYVRYHDTLYCYDVAK